MVLEAIGQPLKLVEREMAQPEPGPILVKISACDVCRTDLHVVDGDLAEAKLPIVPGHEIVGRVLLNGEGVERYCGGERVGIPWLGHTCGQCHYCRANRENLCVQHNSPGIRSTAGLRLTAWPMRIAVSKYRTTTMTCMPHHCFARA